MSSALFRRQRPQMWGAFVTMVVGLFFAHADLDLSIINLAVLAGMAYYFPRAMRRDRALARWLAKS